MNSITVGQLREQLKDVPDDLEVVVRASWEGDEPTGNCFNLSAAVVCDSHADGTDFLALDCDQDIECPHCEQRIDASEWQNNLEVCPNCGKSRAETE